MADSLGRPKLAKIKTLHRTTERGRRRTALPEIEGVQAFAELLDPQVKELARRLDDQKLAERVVELQAQFPEGSVPELVTYDWLEREGMIFTYQASLFGGNRVRGGQVPDFVIDLGGHGVVWRVNGEYWHTRPGQQNNDLIEKISLVGADFNGLRIRDVVDLWERDIYQHRPGIFRMALAGVGLRS